MRALSPYLLMIGAVACRGKNERHVEPASEPQAPALATPSDTKPTNSAPVPATAASSVAVDTASTAASTERPASNGSGSSKAVPRANAVTTEPSAPSTPPLPAPKTEEIRPKRGSAATGPSYEVWLETTGGYTQGAGATVLAVVNAKPPYKCNVQYPYKLVLDAPPASISYPSPTVRGMRVDGKHASMPIPFVATGAGSHTVGGTLSFSTCSEDKCLVDKAHVSVVVQVQ